MYGISVPTFYVVVWRVCRAICASFALPLPQAVEEARRGDDSALRRLAAGFARFTGGIISSCIGAPSTACRSRRR